MKPSVSPDISAPVRLLVVDDDDVDREQVTRLLAKLQIKNTVTQVATLDQARKALAPGEFDCVFLDYHIGDGVGTELLRDIQQGSVAYVPVVMVTGSSNGRLVVEAMQCGAYDYIPKTQLRVDLLETVLLNSLLRAGLERELQAKRERLEYLGLYDELTDLPNRSLFFDRLEQTILEARRNQRTFAVMQIDLNLFKEINDNYGHEAGDVVLATTALRIKNALRESDTVARLGGDEFAAVLVSIDSEAAAYSLSEKIAAAVSEPMTTNQHLLTVTAAAGIALYPIHGEDAHTLLIKADKAMYEAKRLGTLPLVYADEMKAELQQPRLDVCRLQQAVERQELFVQYQPVIELASRQVCGMEALVRWRKPDGEIVPPGVFIPFAERSPMIRSLSYCVLDQVFEQMSHWQGLGVHLPVSVNLSARMLDDHAMPRRVLAGLLTHGLAPTLLTLELTETALMANLEQAQNALSGLIAQGIKISIDDFGAGFTSFKYLRQLEVSELKVDMAFTADIQRPGSRDSVIVRSIAALANGFGIPAVAEGIEDLRNCEKLLQLGCSRGQGYGIARPMNGDAVLDWMAHWASHEQHKVAVRY